MDTLALLCNLHADGPATLQRLRRSGCENLVALGRIAPAELATRLDWTERAAERFLREATLLAQRVELDDESTAVEEPEFELESALVEELDGESDESEHEEEAEEPLAEVESEPIAAASIPAPERVAAVLGAWRELDRVAPPIDPADFVIPRPAPAPDRALTATVPGGLTEDLRQRLAAIGIHTLRELADASTLELARALPAGFTRVKHYQFLAERALASLATTEPAVPIAAPARAFVPPAAEPFDTAGPFA